MALTYNIRLMGNRAISVGGGCPSSRTDKTAAAAAAASVQGQAWFKEQKCDCIRHPRLLPQMKKIM